MTCCSGAKLDIDFTKSYDMPPIRCIDCGEVIAQYGMTTDGCIMSWGYHDTIARINSADSLRCGRCYERHAFSKPYKCTL